MNTDLEQKTQTLLILNLSALTKLHVAPKSLKESIKQGMFSRPNRTAFEEVMHFVVDAYDPELCRSSLTAWPIVERKTQERVFRRQVVTVIEKMASREPNLGVPVLAASFLSTPGGVRLEKFLCRLSALALHRCLQRRGETDMPDLPKGDTERCLAKAKATANAEAGALCQQIKSFAGIATRSADDSSQLNDKFLHTNAALKTALSELGQSETANEILGANMDKNRRDRLEKLQNTLIAVEKQKNLIEQCGNGARASLEDRLVPTMLDGGCDGPLDIPQLLKRVLGVIVANCPLGFPSSHGVALPELRQITEDITAMSQLVAKCLNGVTQLMAVESTSSATPTPERTDGTGTPMISDRIRGACQLLEEASYRTPPLELRPRSNGVCLSLSSDTQSPPISNFTDLLCAKKSAGSIGGGETLPRIQRPVTYPTAQNFSKQSTPARPRSGTGRRTPVSSGNAATTRPTDRPLNVVAKQKTPVVSRMLERKQRNSKGLATRALSRKATSVIQTTKSLSTSSKPSTMEIGTSVTIQQVQDGPIQEVLDLAASLFSPTVEGKSQIFPEMDREDSSSRNPLEPLRFSDDMSDSPHKKEEPKEPEKSETSRKSLLAVIDRFKMITADFASTEASSLSAENGGGPAVADADVGDLDINLDEECDSFIKPFELSLDWEKDALQGFS